MCTERAQLAAVGGGDRVLWRLIERRSRVQGGSCLLRSLPVGVESLPVQVGIDLMHPGSNRVDRVSGEHTTSTEQAT